MVLDTVDRFLQLLKRGKDRAIRCGGVSFHFGKLNVQIMQLRFRFLLPVCLVAPQNAQHSHHTEENDFQNDVDVDAIH